MGKRNPVAVVLFSPIFRRKATKVKKGKGAYTRIKGHRPAKPVDVFFVSPLSAVTYNPSSHMGHPMRNRPSADVLFKESLSILAAFAFVVGLLLSSPFLMGAAAVVAFVRFSLHVVSFARPVTPHFRKERPRRPDRYVG